MKTLILGTLAALVAAAPIATAADAQARQTTTTTVQRGPGGREVVTQRTVTRTAPRVWRNGERFNYRNAPNYRRITEYRTYRLTAPRRGWYWARSGRDAVLVRPNGTIAEVRRGAF